MAYRPRNPGERGDRWGLVDDRALRAMFDHTRREMDKLKTDFERKKREAKTIYDEMKRRGLA